MHTSGRYNSIVLTIVYSFVYVSQKCRHESLVPLASHLFADLSAVSRPLAFGVRHAVFVVSELRKERTNHRVLVSRAAAPVAFLAHHLPFQLNQDNFLPSVSAVIADTVPNIAGLCVNVRLLLARWLRFR